ncbi:MAG: Arc family DNA-binding protein [Cellvibrionaceae bacterium]
MTKPRPYKNPQVNLRIPQSLKDQVEAAADKSGRSMNAEICHRLEESFAGHEVGEPGAEYKAPHLFSIRSKEKSELEELLEEQSDSIVKKLAKLLK